MVCHEANEGNKSPINLILLLLFYNVINFNYPYTPMCVSTAQYFPEFCKKKLVYIGSVYAMLLIYVVPVYTDVF